MQIKIHETPQVDHFSTQCGHHTQLGTRWQMTLILKSSARLGCTYRSRCTFPIGTITIIFIWLMQHEELTGAYGPPKCYKLVSMKINGRFYDHYTQGNFSKKCVVQPISEDFPYTYVWTNREFKYFLPSPTLFHFFSYLRTWIGQGKLQGNLICIEHSKVFLLFDKIVDQDDTWCHMVGLWQQEKF